MLNIIIACASILSHFELSVADHWEEKEEEEKGHPRFWSPLSSSSILFSIGTVPLASTSTTLRGTVEHLCVYVHNVHVYIFSGQGASLLLLGVFQLDPRTPQRGTSGLSLKLLSLRHWGGASPWGGKRRGSLRLFTS